MNNHNTDQKGAIVVTIFDNLYDKIVDYNNIKNAYEQVLKFGRRYKRDAIQFSLKEDLNLVALWQELKNGTYQISPYIRFKVYEPKERWVSAPAFRDKIVQFATHTVLKEVYKNVFIQNSFACIDGRGTHSAVDKVQKNMRIANRLFDDAWIVKFDVSKFFYSIDRTVLKTILRKKISCTKTLWLLDNVIDSSPEGQAGIPLGNVTSQLFANVYLNELDQYCQRFLKARYYVRYMDDVVAIVDTKEHAQKLLKEMKLFVKKRLNIEANPKKSQIFPLKQGVNAYGYKIWTTHRLVRNQSKKAMKRKMKGLDWKLKNGEISIEKVNQIAMSWLGHARHSNSYNLSKKIFVKYPYIKFEGGPYFGNRR